jgi:hypothetical protein
VKNDLDSRGSNWLLGRYWRVIAKFLLDLILLINFNNLLLLE